MWTSVYKHNNTGKYRSRSSMMYSNDKKYLMYINFNIHSGRIPERVECRDYFKKFDWVKFEDLVPEHHPTFFLIQVDLLEIFLVIFINEYNSDILWKNPNLLL